MKMFPRMYLLLILGGLFIVGAASTAYSQDPLLIGYWPFDEQQGTIVGDSSGYGHDGTIFGGAQWITSDNGGALYFNGQDSYVQIPNDAVFNMAGAVTVDLWIKMDSLQPYDTPCIFDKSHRSDIEEPYNSGYAIQRALYQPNAIAFVVGNGSGFVEDNTSNGPLNDGLWHRLTGIASTQNCSTMFFLDGVLTSQLPFSGPIVTNDGDLFIGKHYCLPDRYFSGAVDELRIYDGVEYPFNLSDLYYLPGDVNMHAGSWPPQVLGADVTYAVNYLRNIPTSVPCRFDGVWCSGDVNGDCTVSGSDVIRLVNYLRGTIGLTWCPDHDPAWPTPQDVPAQPPQGWPGCETAASSSNK